MGFSIGAFRAGPSGSASNLHREPLSVSVNAQRFLSAECESVCLGVSGQYELHTVFL